MQGHTTTGTSCAASPHGVDVEIVDELALGEHETAALELHSFLNILTVLLGELYHLRAHLSAPGAWTVLVQALDRVTFDLRTGRFGRGGLDIIERVEASFEEETRLVLEKRGDLAWDAELQDGLENVRSVLRILAVRLAEYVQRLEHPDAWTTHVVRALETNMVNVLAAVEKNSKGRYRIVSNIARQEHQDYVVDLRIESDEGATLSMPAVLQDVLRDLVANARKYTAPGGVINAGLYRSARDLSLAVEDNGIGIPADEVRRVVGFGYRASNVLTRRTHGGGFGLTKAYWVTRRFGGRMWIRSRLGIGTRISIHIPAPAA